VSGGSGGVADERPRGAAYRFAFGPAFLIANTAASRGDGGTEFQLGDLKGNNDPTTTATANVSIPVSARGRINASYGPFEARDEGTFTRDVAFAGRTYAAGTPMFSAWRFYDLRAQYEHLLLDRSGWTGRLGAGLGLSYSYVALQEQGQDDIAVVDDTILYPYAHASLGRRLSGRLGLELAGNGIAMGDDNVLDLSAQFTWRAARAWDFTLGYAYFTRQLDSKTYYNKVRYSIPFATVTRYW
jgi:hypothetical protein